MFDTVQFRDRHDAGEQLADALQGRTYTSPLVLAIPRGGLVPAAAVAERLGADLDVVLVRKLGSPFNPEYAIGAIDETGWTWFPPGADAESEAGGMLEDLKRKELAVLQRRRAQYSPWSRRKSASGRSVILVDDGLATGATMIAALHAVRAEKPAELICAVPVAAPSSLERVRPYADDVVCLAAPLNFGAVGQFYRHFLQVSDEEACDILARHSPQQGASGGAPAS